MVLKIKLHLVNCVKCTRMYVRKTNQYIQFSLKYRLSVKICI